MRQNKPTKDHITETIQNFMSVKNARFNEKNAINYKKLLLVLYEKEKVKFCSITLDQAIMETCAEHTGFGNPDPADVFKRVVQITNNLPENKKKTGNTVLGTKKQYLYDALIWLDTFNLYITHYICRLKQGPVDDFRLIYSAVKSVLEADEPQIRAMTQVAEEVKRFGVEFEKGIETGPQDRKAWLNEYCGYFYNGKRASKEIMEVCDSMRDFFMKVKGEIMVMEGKEK